MPQIPLSQLAIVTVYDPARTRESEYKRLARHAIVTKAMDEDGNIYVLDAWASPSGKRSLNFVLEELERQCSVYQPSVIGVESVAVQTVVGDVAYEWLRMNRNLAPVVDLTPDTGVNKKWRIRMQYQRVAPYGRLFVQSHQHEFRIEYVAFPNGRTIDLLDAGAYCIELLNPPDNNRLDHYKDYLMRRKSDNVYDYESDSIVFSPFGNAEYRQVPTSAEEYFGELGVTFVRRMS